MGSCRSTRSKDDMGSAQSEAGAESVTRSEADLVSANELLSCAQWGITLGFGLIPSPFSLQSASLSLEFSPLSTEFAALSADPLARLEK
jgi:hypothetical protein